MATPWVLDRAPEWGGGDGEVTVMEGSTFCLSDRLGDIGSSEVSGLFVRDTRVLSAWRLTVEGRHVRPLRVHQETAWSAAFLALCPGRTATSEPDLLLTRTRFVGEGMREDIALRNGGREGTRVHLFLEVDADFADLFEVKDGREDAITGVSRRWVGDTLDLGTVRDGAEYAVAVSAAVIPDGAARDDPDRPRESATGLRLTADLPPHGSWSTSVQVVPRLRGRRLVPHHVPGAPVEHAEPARRHLAFRAGIPRLETADRVLADVLARSIGDLAALRIFDPEQPDVPVVAAGAPWFMALFGRDALLTSMMMLPVDATLALGTLTTLASHLGTTTVPLTDEQPGRVPHEVRWGPAGTLALGGRNTYYGSVDATPLFVMALGELVRWQPALVHEDLVRAADRALAWMLGDGDPDGDGFIEYARATDQGLVNQGWKDSWDGVNAADGTLAQAPIALAEVQGYAYAAYLARADIAGWLGDPDGERSWRDRAARLRSAFNEAFWLPERGWYAVGLDRDKAPIDALTSSAGHCLWTGIADQDKADRVAAHLLSPPMATGWGIRTLASDMGAYDPLSYHNGSVWPHDTAICVAGLARYGHLEAAHGVVLGLLDAAGGFGGRIPELFAGFPRDDFPVPVPYPAACAPQAWAAAAPVLLLRTLLGLEPSPEGLRCRPSVPARLLPLRIGRIPCRGARYDVEVDADGWRVGRSEGTAHD